MDRNDWKKKVIDLYESGDVEAAQSLYLTRLRLEGKNKDIHTAVKRLKVESESGFLAVVALIVIALVLYLIFWK